MSIHHFHLKRRSALLLLALLVCIGGLSSVFLLYYSHLHPTLSSAKQFRNIQYCDDSNTARQLDLYIPKEAKANMPLLIFVHGGGWRSGHRDSKLAQLYGGKAIEKGIAVADIGYRLNAPNPFPDENIDVACAMSWLTNHTPSYGVDIEKMVYFGDSAGGQLAAFAALNVPFNGYDYEAPVGVIDLYGVSDFTKIIGGKNPDRNAQFYLGSSYNKQATTASPTNYVTKNAPQFLIIHGTKDTIVPISQSKALFDKLNEYGIDAEFIEINGAGHAFDSTRLPRVEREKMQSSIDTFLTELTGR